MRPVDTLDPELLDRYFAGECDPLEAASVAAFLANAPNWHRTADVVGDLNFSGTQRRGTSTEAAWERVQTRLQTQAQPQIQTQIQTQAKEALAEETASLSHRFVRWGSMAAVGLALMVAVTQYLEWPARILGSGEGLFQKTHSEYVVRNGEHATVQLVDGTQVVLGPGSRLRYSASSDDDARTVEVSGAAYFTVAHNPHRPFTVLAADAAIQELGTQFSVVAYDDDSTVAVVVADGRVAMRSRNAKPQTGVVLSQGDVAHLTQAGLTTVTRDADLETMLGWVHKRLVFDDVPLRDVTKTLSRWYNVDFDFATPTLATRRITLTIGTEPIDEVLMQLSKVLGVQHRQQGRMITITEAR